MSTAPTSWPTQSGRDLQTLYEVLEYVNDFAKSEDLMSGFSLPAIVVEMGLTNTLFIVFGELDVT